MGVTVGRFLAVAPVGLTLAATASAQEVLQEVTVTATRQAESIQNVPVSVSAYDQNAIKQLAMNNIADITRLTPGLDSVTGNTGLSIISIRGIYSTVGTATTGIYIDDTPIQVRFLGAGGAAGSAYPVLFDLDRIEVLRGPQGTLFGSGSEGGTVRFITPQPSLTEWHGHARSEVSFDDNGVPSSQFGVAGGGPLVEGTLGIRASAYVQTDGGWIDLAPYPSAGFPAQRNTNSGSTQALSVALAWAPSDQLTLTPALYYQRHTQDNQNYFWPSLSDPGDHRFVSGALVAQPTLDRFLLPSLRVQWDLPGTTLYSNTSYLDRANDATDDYSFLLTEMLTGNYTGPHTLAPAYFSNPQRQFTQEIRAQSANPESRLHWVAGAFYQRINQRAIETVVAPGLNDLTLQLSNLTVQETFGVPSLPGNVVYSGLDTSLDEQVAGFGQVDFKLTDALTATAGIRIAHSRFSYTNFQDGPFNSGPSGSAGGGSENDNTPKVGLTYKPAQDLMVYASAAKGFRPGGSNTPVSTTLCASDLEQLGLSAAPATYNSDHVWSYELGTKGSALDRRVQWDASTFYIKWNGIESSIGLPSCGFGFTANLGTAVAKGFDLQLSAIVTRGLTLGAAVGYTDSRYSQTVDGAGAEPITSKGDRLPTAPWHFALSADYVFPAFANGAAPYLHVDGQYTSAYHVASSADALYNPVTTSIASTKFSAARAGIKAGSWDVSAFAKNLLNSHSVLSTLQDRVTSDLITQQPFAPRTVGVTATYQF